MYARVNTVTDVVEAQIGRPVFDGTGPFLPPPEPEPGIAYYLLDAPIDWAGAPSKTATLRWNVGDPIWVDTLSLVKHQQRAIEEIDAAGEALRLAVINNLPTQAEEYRQALQQARDWREAGYPESEETPAPPDVTSWAQAKWRDSWSARQAADDILATAELWSTVLSTIRALRLANKEDVRHAASAAEIAAIRSDMRTDMQALAQQLNITLQE